MAVAASVALSIIIPAYNESARLPTTLAAVTRYLAAEQLVAEIIVVNDGSGDDTSGVARRAGARVLDEPHRGKAAALRAGVRAAEGAWLLLMDADLATPIEEWSRCRPLIDAGADIVIGSRELAGSRRIGEPWYRHAMGRVFNHLVGALLMRGVRDTQCGFKALRRDVALDLFGALRLYGADAAVLDVPAVTAYDVELIYLARLRGYTLAQLPVTWYFGAGTTVHPWRDTVRNFSDLVRVRRMARRGLYAGTPAKDAHAFDEPDDLVIAPENAG